MPKCTECREQISSGANICPYCQSKVYKPDFGDILWMFKWGAIVLFVICLIGARGNVFEAINSFLSVIKVILFIIFMPLIFFSPFFQDIFRDIFS